MNEADTGLRRRDPVLLGGIVGLTWGVIARLWMRFISQQPEFSWGGTGIILGAATLAGLSLGLAHRLRAGGARRWWRLLGLGTVFLAFGAGAIMVPTVILWSLAMARRGWPSAIRVALWAAGVIAQVILVLPALELGPVERSVAVVWYVCLLLTEAWGLSVVFSPRIVRVRGAEAVVSLLR